MAERVVQLNDVITADNSCDRLPYRFFHALGAGKVTSSLLMTAAKIYSFASLPGKELKKTYADFEHDLGISRSTVSRNLGRLKRSGVIGQRKTRTGAAYTFEANIEDTRAFVRIEPWMRETVFEIRGEEPRRLTNAEIVVLAHIYTHASNPDGKGGCRGSVRMMAAQLCLSDSTVGEALSVLKRANLVVLRADERGTNGSNLSTYRINGRRIRKVKKARRKAQESRDRRTKTEIEADKRSERERAEWAQRAAAESRAAANLERMMRDDAFRAAETRRRKLDIELVIAELRSPADVARLREEEAEIAAVRAERLRAYGLTAEDLRADYTDTGGARSGSAPPKGKA